MDQFYTKETIAFECFSTLKKHIDIKSFDYQLEPSAGTGSFYKLLNHSKRIGLDIDPKYEGVIDMDYFNFKPKENKTYIVVGNPPFGKVSSLAVKFFNKSAEFADCIAFIVPRTFKRVSIQNQLNLFFSLVHTQDLPIKPCCFVPSMNAKCCFQIWKKTFIPREKINYDSTHQDFTFLKLGSNDARNQPTPPINADFVVKAYGMNCGVIRTRQLDILRPKSWHWIQSNIDVEELIKRLSALDYSISKDTVRQDSLGKKELIYLYKLKYG